MNDDHRKNANLNDGTSRGFIAEFLMGLVRDAVKFILAFAIGTAAGAVVCWYYDIPLVFSLLGGILVLGLALAISSDSLFS